MFYLKKSSNFAPDFRTHDPMADIVRLFHKACAEHHLIEYGDRILIGLSGGKDSLTLLELLGEQMKAAQPRFELFALHVRMREIEYESSTEYLHTISNQYAIPLIIKEASIGEIQGNKTPCFLCSWFRRKTLFDVAQEMNCNKIALGHNKDDLEETFLMNLLYEGTLATNPPRLKLDKMPLTIIRPLCMIDEKDIEAYAVEHDYQVQTKRCPFEKDTAREQMKQLLVDLERFNPQVRESIWGAMTNVKLDYLPRQKN